MLQSGRLKGPRSDSMDASADESPEDGLQGAQGESQSMYQFSRSIYRELAPRVEDNGDAAQVAAARHEVLDACEATMMRLATDRRYFARPTRTLFSEVREHFAL